MRPNPPTRTASIHIARADKSQRSQYGCPAWPLLLCISLIQAQTSSAAGGEPERSRFAPATLHEQTSDSPAHPGREPVITEQNGVYTIFDRHRHEHAYIRQPDGRLSPLGNTSGKLEHIADGQHRWTTATGEQLRFVGSTLASSAPAEHIDCAPSSPALPAEQTPDIVTQPDTPAIDAPAPPTTRPPVQPQEPQQCDTQNEGPHTFQSTPYQGPQTTLDARPASCESYFVEYYGTRRGSQIETGLYLHAPYERMQSTSRTFPIIDFIDESTLYVVHSRDLGNRTFNSPSRPNALFDQLMDDGEEIQTRFLDVIHEQGSISAGELGQITTIRADQLRPITLQLVIRDGIASADHWQQIALAREQLMTRFGITLEVVIIP